MAENVTSETKQSTDHPTAPTINESDSSLLLWLGLMGLIVGVGQLLASEERLTWRIVIGRALISCGLGMSATVIFLWFPSVPFFVLMGIASAIVSLGTSGMERAFQIVFRRG